MALKKSQKSLKKWTKQKWRTPSGKKSSETGEVYAPAATIKKLKSTAKGKRNWQQQTKRKEPLLQRESNTQNMVYIKERNDNAC